MELLKPIKLKLLIPLALVFSAGCYQEFQKENESDQLPSRPLAVVKMNGIAGMVDEQWNNILFTLPNDTVHSFSPVIEFSGYDNLYFEGKMLEEEEENDLGMIAVNHSYTLIGEKELERDTFEILFTTLPLIQLTTLEEIRDEPKQIARLEMHYNSGETEKPTISKFETLTGIEIRGRHSMQYPKKSYGFELWRDVEGSTYAASLLGMRFGKDWILDAMYSDDLRMRNKISFEIWEKLADLPDMDYREGVVPGIRCRYVELFINNSYSGLYCLNERIDKHLLQFQHNQSELGGVLYKAIEWDFGSTRFETYRSEPASGTYWDGWELQYPEHTIYWTPLAELRKLIVHEPDSIFINEIGSRYDLKNAMDLYLFLNLLAAYDNTGKNTYLVRYEEESPFFIIPWDLEASWGKMWDGTNSNYWGILENHLIHRLIDTNLEGFADRIPETWQTLRDSQFNRDTLVEVIHRNFDLLYGNGVFAREYRRWEIQDSLEEEYQYLMEWLIRRLNYLDSQFDQNSELK
jgi:hypothetical protein